MKRAFWSAWLFLLMVTLGSNAWCAAGQEHAIRVDAAAHQRFGLYYPATYLFDLPAGATGLSAQYRYSSTDTWKTLPPRSGSDLFNGTDAVRFDYLRHAAFASVRFSRSSNEIFLRFLDSAGKPVTVTFISTTRYYDDRKAAVTVTIDDWADWSAADVDVAIDFLASSGLCFTGGVITSVGPWSSIQNKINQYPEQLEVASHSMNHPCYQGDYLKAGYQTEVTGSRDAIRNNLTLENDPYVPAWLGTCTYTDATLTSTVAGADYLVTRSGGFDPRSSAYAPWDPVRGTYGKVAANFSTFAYAKPNDSRVLTDGNAKFDEVYAAGGIYHLMDHPWQKRWFTGSYLMQHINHIKGRRDVWYVPFGSMYQYNFLHEMRGNLRVEPTVSVLAADFSATPVSGPAPLSVQFTDASSGGSVSSWLWNFGDSGVSTLQNPTHVYTAAGSYAVRLTVTGPQGSNTKVQPGYISVGLAEYDPPTGSVTINGGAAYSKSPQVTLNLSASDASGVGKVCISNTPACTLWTSYTATKAWALPAGSGDRTVYVWFKDTLGNANPTPYSAKITVDAAAPVNGTLTVTPTPGTFTLNWQGFSDLQSGIKEYRLVAGRSGYPLCSAAPIYTGTATTYPDSSVVSGTTYYYRVCAVDNAGNVSTGAMAMKKALAEYTPPTGSVTINGGARFTKSPVVNLALTADDASGVSQVCVSNAATCSQWTAFTATRSWTLAPVSGVKTVNVWFKDTLGNVNAAPYSASIALDQTPPVNGTLAINAVTGSFTLTWQGFSDPLSGIAEYRLVGSTASYPSCAATPLYSGTGNSYTQSGITLGTTYYYRVCAVDNVGNVSSGALARQKGLTEYIPPTGSIAINGGAAYTRTPLVHLALAASDASGIGQVCISNSATCTVWTPFTSTKSWTLLPGSGVKTVNVWYRDTLGNATPTPYSASITLDSTPPVNGTVSVAPSAGTFTVNWTGFQDATSGIAAYRLTKSAASYPACTASALYTGNATSYADSDITVGTTYYYRVCAVDNAGNISTGATTTRKGAPEYDPPAGAVSINGGASYTRTPLVTLALSASDASGVAQVCISNSASCTLWVPFASTRSWTLPAGNGAKTVNVWFRDIHGNANAVPYPASIVLDAKGPTGSLLIDDSAPATSSGAVTLTLSATDDASSVASMQFSNDGVTWSPVEGFAPVKDWTLAPGTGVRRACVRYLDGAGNSSAVYCDTITVTPAF
jgi:PKD repeat protein